MRGLLAGTVLACLMFVPAITRADGLLYQLPKDGAAVLFDVEMNMSRGGQERTATGTLKMSSVGTSTENGEKCRWIEFKVTLKIEERERIIVVKILVPEKNLKEGENAYGNNVRGWIRMRPDGEVVKLDDSNRSSIPAFLAGPLSDAKKLEREIVESKLGKLKCAGVTGYVEYVEGVHKKKATFETRRHTNAPFGVVSTKITFEGERDGQLEQKAVITFKLKEVSKDATSDLPDAN